jgi:hypothetical protein
MERYSKLQFEHIQALHKQLEARLTRTETIALIIEWRQREQTRNYQREYDRIRNELEQSALPFQTQENVKKSKVELESLVLTYIM